MKHYITSEEATLCNNIAANLAAIHDAQQACVLTVAQAKDILPLSAISEILDKMEEIRGIVGSIDMHPQSEWMGGDSMNPANFKIRRPDFMRKHGIA
jgi:hypothetical protein